MLDTVVALADSFDCFSTLFPQSHHALASKGSHLWPFSDALFTHAESWISKVYILLGWPLVNARLERKYERQVPCLQQDSLICVTLQCGCEVRLGLDVAWNCLASSPSTSGFPHYLVRFSWDHCLNDSLNDSLNETPLVSGTPSGEPILRQLRTGCQQDEVKQSSCLFKNHSLEVRWVITDKLQE